MSDTKTPRMAEIAGAFSMGRHGTVFARSGLSMQVALSRKNIQGGLALESRHKGAPGLWKGEGALSFLNMTLAPSNS